MRLFTLMILLACCLHVSAQSKLTLEEAIDLAKKNNKQISAASFDVEAQRQLKKTSIDLPKTDVNLLYGQYNSYANDNNITVLQSIPMTALGSQGKLNRAILASTELQKSVVENEVVYRIKQVYYELLFINERKRLLQSQDSIFEGFLKSASLRYKTGETNLLEKATAESQRNEVKNQLRRIESEINSLQNQLKTLINADDMPQVDSRLEPISSQRIDSVASASNPSLAYSRQQIEVANRERRNEAAKAAPELLVGFFSQTLIGVPNEDGSLASNNDRFTGIQVGMSLPLWFGPHRGRIKAAEYKIQAEESRFEQYQLSVRNEVSQALQRFENDKSSLEYYRTSALPNAELIMNQSQAAFREGEVGYAEFLLGLRNAIAIREAYLQTLNDYNQSIIYLEYLSGNK